MDVSKLLSGVTDLLMVPGYVLADLPSIAGVTALSYGQNYVDGMYQGTFTMWDRWVKSFLDGLFRITTYHYLARPNAMPPKGP